MPEELLPKPPEALEEEDVPLDDDPEDEEELPEEEPGEVSAPAA